MRAFLVLLVLFGFGVFIVRDYAARHPEDMPWTPLDLDAPVGAATARKLAALVDDPALCQKLLRDAGIVATPAPARSDTGPGCSVAGALRVDDLGLPLYPARLTMTCPIAAATVVWSRQVVRPAARTYLGTNATALVNNGSYNCRRIAGSLRLSEHATANALDIAGVRTARGGTVTVVRDWNDPGPRGAFIREIHAGACRLYGVVLGPDYNAAHRDHFHVDFGAWRACR